MSPATIMGSGTLSVNLARDASVCEDDAFAEYVGLARPDSCLLIILMHSKQEQSATAVSHGDSLRWAASRSAHPDLWSWIRYHQYMG
jgi:hypothetical protein